MRRPFDLHTRCACIYKPNFVTLCLALFSCYNNMKFAQALAPLAFAAVALAVPTSLEARQSGWCASSAKALAYGIVTETWVYDLGKACARNTDAAASGNLWANKVCVAAALAAPQHLGPKIIAGAASCNNPEGITSLAGIPSLDYNVYAGIVGECAWQEGGCPVTRQNFIDLVYSAIDEIGTGRWPSSADAVVSMGWDRVSAWTKTGEEIPYLNLNDFLHYA
ncbi:hypothetical protein C8Q76DRAFT_20921 [Earliella scabrosa]|nr:hypothetical protein C8Q76DRAFT_20921 [Earliella scabrosa]